MRVLVTGGTGFIGVHLIDRLLKNGNDVTVLTRKPHAPPDKFFPKGKLRWRVGDIRYQETVLCKTETYDVVYHLAGLIGPGLLSPPYIQENVQGVENMLLVAQKSEVRRFIYVSSIAAYAPQDGQIDETAPLQTKKRDAYAASKALGDILVQRAMTNTPLECVIVRPARVYDSGENRTDFRYFVRWLQRFPFIPLRAGGHLPCEIVHVRDLAELLIRCGELPVARNQIYNASSDEGLTWKDILTTMTQHPPHIIHVRSPLQGATFPAAKAKKELQFIPRHRWEEIS